VRAWGSLALAGSMALFAFLTLDAFTYALEPVTPSRARGCYTSIEDLVGVSEPSWIRPAQQVLSPVFFLVSPMVFFLRARRLRRLQGGLLVDAPSRMNDP
jgi:hypothetical protein